MTLREFIDAFRSDVADAQEPFLWSDDDVLRYLNRSVNRLAQGADYFLDTTTWKGIEVAENNPIVPSSNSIIRVARARLQEQSMPLAVMTMSEYENGSVYDDYGIQVVGAAWEDRVGLPRALLTDYQQGAFRLTPIPMTDYLLDLWVYRLPTADLNAQGNTGAWNWDLDIANDVLEGLGGAFVSEDERVLLDGVKAEAYDKQDADAADEDLHTKFEQKFLTGLLTIRERLQSRRRPMRPVRTNRDYAY